MRVVLDTDVLLAAFVSPHGASRQWLSAVLRGEVEVMVSVPLVLEYEAVLVRRANPRRVNATVSEVERLIDAVVAQAHPVAISYLWRPTLRDPGDEMVLEAAVNSRADWIITFNVTDYAGAERFQIRNKSGKGYLQLHSRLTPLDLTSSQLLNRTAVRQARP